VLNLESLNYLNQSSQTKNSLSKEENVTVTSKDFKSYLSKEKELNNEIIEVKDTNKDVEIEIYNGAEVKAYNEVNPLEVDKEKLTKISDNIEEKLNMDEEKIPLENLNEILLLIGNLFSTPINNENTNLEGMNIENFNLKDMNFEDFNLEGINIENSNLKDMNIEGFNLEGMDSENFNLKDVDLETIETLLTDTFDEFKNILLNSNTNVVDSKEVLDIINNSNLTFKKDETKEILIEINNLLKENINLIENNEILKAVESNLRKSITDLFNSIDTEEFKSVIDGMTKEDKSNILNTLKILVNENSKNITLEEVKLELKENNISISNLLNKHISNEEGLTSFENETLKEDKILNKVINDGSETKFINVINNTYDRFNNTTVKVVEQIPIAKVTMNEDIIQNVKYMVMNDIEELTVKIYPKELGEITIKILSEEGIMRADIKSTSKETYNLINSHILEMKNSFEEQNIKIQDVNISIYNEDTTFFSGKDGRNEASENNQTGSNIISDLTLEEAKIDYSVLNNNLDILA